MNRRRRLIALALFCACGLALAGPAADPDKARFVTEDIDRFWEAWDLGASAKLRDDRARIFFNNYYMRGSPGLRDFIKSRIGSIFELMDVIDAHPRYYLALRNHTGKVKQAEEPTREAFRKLKALYPEAVFPDVYFVIGRLSSGGTTSQRGLLIGAEMYGMYPDTPTAELDDWLKTVLKPMDDLPHIVVHESIHYQQDYPEESSLLAAAVKEGSADFLAELVSGRHINEHVHEWARPRARELWLEFEARMGEPGLDGWLYGGDRDDDGPRDLGYWIGYEISKAYYDRAEDKQQAIREILDIEDFAEFLAASGYPDRWREEP